MSHLILARIRVVSWENSGSAFSEWAKESETISGGPSSLTMGPDMQAQINATLGTLGPPCKILYFISEHFPPGQTPLIL